MVYLDNTILVLEENIYNVTFLNYNEKLKLISLKIGVL